MWTTFVRSICLFVVRLFFREISISYVSSPPDPEKPTLVLANHPNGLIDPIVLRIALKREVGFLGKSTLFENWFGRTAMEAFSAIPVYRKKDGEDTSKNRRTFDLVEKALADGKWIALFPEGVSHDAPKLQPLKTGAARMYFDAVENNPETQIVSLGLDYENKSIFRSRVAVTVGIPIQASGDSSDRERVDALTEEIATALSDLTLEAGSSELKEGFLWVAKWMEGEDASIKDIDRRSKSLADAYTRLVTKDRAEADALVEDVRSFARRLDSVGLDAWELDESLRIKTFVPYMIGFPFAFVGAVLSYPTYKLIGPVARKFAGSDLDLVSTIKALAGLVFFPITWAIQTLIAWQVSPKTAIVLAIIAMPLSLFALQYFERLEVRKSAIRAFGFRTLDPNRANDILKERKALAVKVKRALAS